jgi:hypothetical protein
MQSHLSIEGQTTSLKYVAIYVNEDSHEKKRKEGREEAQPNEVSGGPPEAARHPAKRRNLAYEVVVAAAPRFARENALLLSSATASPVLSISIEPLK